MAFTFLMRRRLRLLLPKPPPPISASVIRHFSAYDSAANPSTSTLPDTKPSLSARLSFVFDQIDALERQRDIAAKDEALQRIRAWRQSKHAPPPPISSSSTVSDVGSGGSDSQITGDADAEVGMADLFQREVEVVHPWPEWIEFMVRLATQNYFDYRRVEEDRFAKNAGIDLSGVKEEVGLDLTRDWAAVRTASMNFGRDRFDILKSLSKKDIQILVGHGCPSMDPKVVFSAKLLRKYVHLDEGDVCSSCILRNTCSRGYILVPKEDEARTLDVMRLLLTYGFDHVKDTVENSPLRKMKSVKNVVRKLLFEVVKLSAVPRDPNLLPPVIKKPLPKVKQPPPQPKRRVGRDDVEMKKGDWLCTKCDFMNFAKNTVCLQCDSKRPKRQLLPGEWECPRCNFLNYRRNMSCFHCEHKRPPDDFTENQMQGKQMGPSTRLQMSTRVPDVSNAWNFDFDDDESDGADVAAFEFADSAKAHDGSLNLPPHGGSIREFDDDIRGDQDRDRQFSNPHKRNSLVHSRHTGFDDFDDEEDDNLDSYELDEANDKETHVISRKSFSEFEKGSGSEDFDDLHQHANSSHHRKDFVSDSEDDLVVSARKIEDKRGSLGYDDNMHGNYDLKAKKTVQQNAGLRYSRKTRDSDLDSHFDDELSVSELDDDDDTGSEDNLYSRSKKNGNRRAPERTGGRFEDSNRFVSRNGRNSFNSHNDDEFDDREGSDHRRRGRANQFSNGASFQRNGRSSNGNGHGRWKDDSSKFQHSFGRSDSGKSDYRRNGRKNINYDRSRGFDNGSFGRSDSGKSDYRKNGRKNNSYDKSRGFDDGYDFRDNNRRRRIIER